MKKNYPFLISLIVMFATLPFDFPNWLATILGLQIWVNFAWALYLLIK